MQAKKDLVENVSAVMKEIENSSKEIDNITNIINDIRFQAHLLALNATIEAARAGEAGRGFAVIAAEIKNLAQKTAESSKTIRPLVTQNMASVKKGLELAHESSVFFSAVMEMINELALKIDEIPGPAQTIKRTTKQPLSTQSPSQPQNAR
ncbi:MAG: methyl-accepting chemotaxis protein [Candidatus Aminicenantes bacterium]|nr:methyl-accepting chemotaxis protein [Candidatus Aminicenantes bacterium]